MNNIKQMKQEKIEHFMREAIKEAKKGIIKEGQSPFGAVIVKKGKIIARGHNRVVKCKDATCHAEINAIRNASRKLKSWNLKGCEIFSTAEACPMCFCAIHWANIDKIYYGVDTWYAKKCGFNELLIHDDHLKTQGKSKVKIQGKVLEQECKELFLFWKKNKNKKLY